MTSSHCDVRVGRDVIKVCGPGVKSSITHCIEVKSLGVGVTRSAFELLHISSARIITSHRMNGVPTMD
jgi:hypothetical protein